MAKDIFDVLSKQHDEAKKILDKLAVSSVDDAQIREDLGADVAVALISHNQAESEILYRRLAEFEDLRHHVEEHEEEHEEANEELRELLELDVETEEWLECLTNIKQAVEHHIEDEEGKLFPEARRHLHADEVNALAQAFEELQARRKQTLQAA